MILWCIILHSIFTYIFVIFESNLSMSNILDHFYKVFHLHLKNLVLMTCNAFYLAFSEYYICKYLSIADTLI